MNQMDLFPMRQFKFKIQGLIKISVFSLLLVCTICNADEYNLLCGYASNEPASEFEPHYNCATRKDGVLVVSKEHLENMYYSEDGLAAAIIDDQWYYIKPNGKLLPIITYDNGADYFKEGLTRSLVDGKIAYFDAKFQQVIGPKYDWGWPFENGFALVCNGCNPGPRDDDGHTFMLGGKWGYIDKSGKEIVPLIYSSEEIRSHNPH